MFGRKRYGGSCPNAPPAGLLQRLLLSSLLAREWGSRRCRCCHRSCHFHSCLFSPPTPIRRGGVFGLESASFSRHRLTCMSTFRVVHVCALLLSRSGTPPRGGPPPMPCQHGCARQTRQTRFLPFFRECARAGRSPRRPQPHPVHGHCAGGSAGKRSRLFGSLFRCGFPIIQ